MKALILAGGYGTRLRPLTYTRPKHLLPIANRPHIEHVFDLLMGHGVTDVVLLTSYLAETFDVIVERGVERGMTIAVTHEAEPLGTAGALRNAEALVSGGTFLAFNGDILTDVDLGALVERHAVTGAEATILLTPVDDPSAYGVVPTDADGRVLGFIEKPPAGEAPTNLINAGVYVLEPSILARIPEGEVWSAERRLFPGLVDEGAGLYATGTDAYWMDIGTPQKYLQANLDALAGAYRTDAAAALAPNEVLAAKEAVVASGAMVSSACIGPGARVEGGAVLERCVLLAGSRVERGAEVRDSILGEGAAVEAGARVSETVIADHEVVRPSS